MKGTDKFTQARVRAAGQRDRATQTSAHRWRRRRQHTVQYIEGQSETQTRADADTHRLLLLEERGREHFQEPVIAVLPDTAAARASRIEPSDPVGTRKGAHPAGQPRMQAVAQQGLKRGVAIPVHPRMKPAAIYTACAVRPPRAEGPGRYRLPTARLKPPGMGYFTYTSSPPSTHSNAT